MKEMSVLGDSKSPSRSSDSTGDGPDSGSPIRQRLQHGGHQHPRDGLVEDGVTHTHDVDHGGGAQHGQHVRRHPLPEVQQEALHLNAPPNRHAKSRGGRGVKEQCVILRVQHRRGQPVARGPCAAC